MSTSKFFEALRNVKATDVRFRQKLCLELVDGSRRLASKAQIYRWLTNTKQLIVHGAKSSTHKRNAVQICDNGLRFVEADELGAARFEVQRLKSKISDWISS